MAYKSRKHVKKTNRKNTLRNNKKHGKRINKKNTLKHKNTKRVKFNNKAKRTHKKVKVIRRKTPYMKGGFASLEQFMPSNFQQAVPFLPPKGNYVELSQDMHGINNTLESSTNIPVNQNGGGLTDFIPTDITNLGRNIVFGGKSLYNNYMGDTVTASANPNVTVQPELAKIPVLDANPTDVNGIYLESDMKSTTL
jgi:hypothetical protein